MSFGSSFASSVIFTILAVSEGSTALVWLPYYKRLPSNDFFTLQVLIFLNVIDLSVPGLYFGERLLSDSQGIKISTSCAELLSVFLR